VLEAILDSASMLPVAGVPALIPQVDGVNQPAEARPAHARAITDVTLQVALPTSAPETHTAAVATPIAEGAVQGAPDFAAPETRVAPAQAAATQSSAETATPTPAALLAAAGKTLPSTETVALAQKSVAPGQKPATPLAPVHSVNETRENREAVGSQQREEPLLVRADTTVERPQINTFVTGSATDKPTASDAAPEPPNATSSLDSLSSAALMPKWASASHASSATNASTPATARIDTPIATEGWGDAFRQKVVWLVDRQQQTAELHVNPPHLGPVEVMLNLTDDGAHIVFCSPHASVRDAIEGSLAELRTALANNGLSLGQALVSADPGTAREQFQEAMARKPQSAGSISAEALPLNEFQAARPLHRGLVDIFA
jgi:flagellar hook-length control protein FliK